MIRTRMNDFKTGYGRTSGLKITTKLEHFRSLIQVMVETSRNLKKNLKVLEEMIK